MSIYTHRTLIIVTAADRITANAAAASLPGAGPADLQTFTVGLSATGAEPATHYVCSSVFDDADRRLVDELKAQFPTAVVADYDLESEPGFPDRILGALGLRRLLVNLG